MGSRAAVDPARQAIDRVAAPLARAEPVSVVHFVAPGRVGGLESVVHALAIGSRGSAVHARVAAVIPAGELDHPFFQPLREAGVEAIGIPVPPRSYLREREAIVDICRQMRVHVLHTHGYHADVVAASGARRLGIPLVTTVHGYTGCDWKNRFYEWLQRRMLARFQAVVAVSRALGEQLGSSGVPRDRLHVIQNGWRQVAEPLERGAARKVLGLPADGWHVGWVGRLTGEKAPDLFLDALARLQDVPYQASVLAVGPARAGLEARASRGGINDRVRWHGTVGGAGRLFRAFDVFVLSSRTEGIPIVLFEAMAAGVPIVATAVGGVPEVLSDQQALLVPPDDPTALAMAIRNVWQRPDLAARRAIAARERLRSQFALAPWLDRYEALYRALRDGRSPGSKPAS